MVKIESKKVICLVTGASQGIGRSIAVEFSKKFGAGSKLLLIARSKQGLEETKKEVEQNSKDIKTELYPLDLSQPDASKFDDISKLAARDSYDLLILVHNAGSEGMSKFAVDINDLQEWQKYMALNLYSVTMLTSSFLKALSNIGSKLIINITSLAAVQPFKGMGYYCIGKAAREMYFRTLAEENPELNILNYSPGIVYTEMVTRLVKSAADPTTKNSFENIMSEKKYVQPHETVEKLIKTLEDENYKSGGRLDFMDLP